MPAEAESLALQIVDVLGGTSDEELQAALCRAVWELCGTQAARTAVAMGGGILYAAPLLAAAAPSVQHEAALVLTRLTHGPRTGRTRGVSCSHGSA